MHLIVCEIIYSEAIRVKIIYLCFQLNNSVGNDYEGFNIVEIILGAEGNTGFPISAENMSELKLRPLWKVVYISAIFLALRRLDFQ